MTKANYLPLLAERVIGRPLLLVPSMAELLFSVIEGRIDADGFNVALDPAAPEATRFIGTRQPTSQGVMRLNRVSGKTALITIDGGLVNRGAWIGANVCTGLTSYEGITALVREAEADPEIENVVFDINSGGGEATGMFTAAAAIRKLAKTKYVIASVNDMAASAAYGLASAADEIVISPTSVVGSIGVVQLHLDRSAEMAAKGIRPTLIHAGAHKVDGHPFGPLPENVRAAMQRDTLAMYDRFLESVEAGRGKSRLSAKKARETEARVFIGEDAIAAGLADRVASFEEVLADLNRPARRATTPQRSKSAMKPTAETETPAVVASLNAADHTAIATSLLGLMKAEGLVPAAPAAATPAPAAPAAAPPAVAEPATAQSVVASLNALLDAPEAQGKRDAAIKLFGTGLGVDQVKAALEHVPVSASVATRAARDAGKVEIGAATDEQPTQAAIATGWSNAFKRLGRK